MENITRNIIISCACGAVFGFSWWLMIDIIAYYPEVAKYKHGLAFLPIALSTLSLFINGFIPNSSLVDVFTLTKTIFLQRFVFFVSMVMAFGGLLSAILLTVLKEASSIPMYGLVGIPVLNALILISNLVFKFGVTDDSDDLF